MNYKTFQNYKTVWCFLKLSLLLTLLIICSLYCFSSYNIYNIEKVNIENLNKLETNKINNDLILKIDSNLSKMFTKEELEVNQYLYILLKLLINKKNSINLINLENTNLQNISADDTVLYVYQLINLSNSLIEEGQSEKALEYYQKLETYINEKDIENKNSILLYVLLKIYFIEKNLLRYENQKHYLNLLLNFIDKNKIELSSKMKDSLLIEEFLKYDLTTI